MRNKTVCSICPRHCSVERSSERGFCGMGESLVVAKAFLHMWEEPCVSGTRGSGTVFFSGCNLKCVFCQNFKISQENFGEEITVNQLANIFLSLQAKGAHNINLVNPTHFTEQIRQALIRAEGLRIPIVYNTNGYDSIEGLKLLEGQVDVYLPDIKYFFGETSRRYSKAEDYFEVAGHSIQEMYRQVGAPIFDSDGMIRRGLVIRHLILPGHAKESMKILEWVRNVFPHEVYVSLMSQYTPFYHAHCHPEINRRITRWEYEKVVNYFIKLGFENGYIQERDSAMEEYIPDFNLEGIE